MSWTVKEDQFQTLPPFHSAVKVNLLELPKKKILITAQ